MLVRGLGQIKRVFFILFNISRLRFYFTVFSGLWLLLRLC